MNWKDIIGAVGSAGGALSPWLSVGSSVLGSILGSKSQSNANAANLQMNQATNQANMQMNQANIDATRANMFYQTQQNMAEAQRGRDFEALQAQLSRNFNAEQARLAREASTPEFIVKSRLAAGLSPLADVNGSAAAMAGSSPGSAPIGSGGSFSLPSPIPMQAGHVSPVDYGLGAVSDALGNISKILSNEKISSAGRKTTERGQDIQKDLGDASNQAAQTAADAAVKQAEASSKKADAEVKRLNSEDAYQVLVNNHYEEILQSRLNLEKAQAYNYTQSVASAFASVNATLKDIAARLEMNHNNLVSTWNIEGARLEQDWNKFTSQMELLNKQYDLDKYKADFSFDMAVKQFSAENGGLNALWNWLGVAKFGGVAGSIAMYFLGKKTGLPPSKSTSTNVFRDARGYNKVTHETYFPTKIDY